MADDTDVRPEDDRIDIDPEDDEASHDPEGEPDTEGTESEDDEGADEQDAAAAEPQARGRRQFGELRETNRTLAEQNAALTRRMAELEGRVAGAQQTYYQPQETVEQRESRLSLLSDGERARVELREELARRDHRDRQLQFQIAESRDKSAFSTLATTNQLAKRFESEVERKFEEFQSKGAFVERSVILKQIIGERALDQAGKPRRRAADNRQRQQARPSSSGSDVRPSRGRASPGSAADFEARFGDVEI